MKPYALHCGKGICFIFPHKQLTCESLKDKVCEKSDSEESQDLILSSLLISNNFKLVWGILAMHIKFDFYPRKEIIDKMKDRMIKTSLRGIKLSLKTQPLTRVIEK